MTVIHGYEIVNEIARYAGQLRVDGPSGAYGRSMVSRISGRPCCDIRLSTVELFEPFANSGDLHTCIWGDSAFRVAAKED